ncbi:hypothetical protein CAL7716_002320 [Calothrix sp. PCC 7716]|nr:hypothetical protein CAL7716_002320 [Calothrix sp. PCC 7716]
MWKVEYTKRFLKDLADLPEDMQARIEPIVFQELESENPFDIGYLEKIKGYDDKYKINPQHLGESYFSNPQDFLCTFIL